MATTPGSRRLMAIALLCGGAAAGAIIATTVTSSADTPAASTTSGYSTTPNGTEPTGGTAPGNGTAPNGNGTAPTGLPANPNAGDPSKPQRSDEQLLTGTTAEKVKAAALAKYPGATVERVETDSEGVYEAHIVSNGQHLIVQVGANFTVTGTQTMGQQQ